MMKLCTRLLLLGLALMLCAPAYAGGGGAGNDKNTARREVRKATRKANTQQTKMDEMLVKKKEQQDSDGGTQATVLLTKPGTGTALTKGAKPEAPRTTTPQEKSAIKSVKINTTLPAPDGVVK